jgi:tRNA(Ile)-lysidine synthase
LVGISGGADSSTLLHLLAHCSDEFHYRLSAAYFDHEIRPDGERAAELEAVRRIAATAKVPLRLGGAPVRLHARGENRSLEEQARIERYRFFRAVASEIDAQFVAVGHTKDDQAESILLHTIRGSGIRGLAGMAESQAWPIGEGPTLLRPLLGFRRIETAAYCSVCGIATHTDSENESMRYHRNKVRLQILPAMEEINPRAVEAIARLGEAAREQLQLIDGLDRIQNAPLQLGLGDLGAMPAALRAESLSVAFTGSRQGLTRKHIAAINDLLETSGEHRLSLPGGVEVIRDDKALRFRPAQVSESPNPPAPPVPLAIPGNIRFAGWEVTTEFVPAFAGVQTVPTAAVIAADVASEGLTVRPWRTGDRIQPAGMIGHKKLQDLFVDLKIPRSERNSVPVVCAGDDPLWVVGVRADGRADCRDSKQDRVLITACKLDRQETATIG